MSSESFTFVDIDTDLFFSIKLVSRIADASVTAFKVDTVFDGTSGTANIGIVAALVDVHAALVVVSRIISIVTLAVEATDSIRALAIRTGSFNHRAFVNINTDAVALGKTIIADAIVASLFVDAMRELRTFCVGICAFIIVDTFVRAGLECHSRTAFAFDIMSRIFNAVPISTEIGNLIAS